MKVDKGVCTTNDAYFEGNKVANELNSIIKFETVFSTLVENKILAIKRECEQHETKKRTRTLKNILYRKTDGNIETKRGSRKNFFLRHKNKQQSSDVDIEKGEQQADNDEVEARPTSQAEELVKVEVQNDKSLNDQGLLTNDGDEPSGTLDSQSNDQLAVSYTDSNDKSGQQNCDNLLVKTSTDDAQLSLSTNNSSIACSNKTIKESSKHNELDESSATTIDISLQQSSVVAQVKATPINREKSDIAVCDDVSSQNTSDIEFSLVSESISELPAASALKKTSTISDPILKKLPLFLSPPLAREIKISERRTVSCQSTPIFGRHQKAQLKCEGDVKKVLTFQTELPKKVCEPKSIEKQKSQTIVIAPTSTTTTTTLAKPLSTVSGPLENVHKRSQKRSKYRDVSLEYEISYEDNDGQQSPRGFISSFNHLTSQSQPVAVISSYPKKQSSRGSKAQLQSEATGVDSDEKTAKHHEIELELDELAVDESIKRKEKRKQISRCADSLNNPSSSGLRHCILSRPPNQPIQAEYDSGFMYDVSLQTESEFNGEIKSIVPAEHKKHRTKHQHHDHERCKERRRRRKRKILVHNLDDKSVKVIDPDSDELPQRAKFTIIATACLLLIMCLLLVGVTLRMAPFIDDMVREENRRLLQESLDFAKRAENFTEPPIVTSTTSTPPTSKMLQASYVP